MKANEIIPSCAIEKGTLVPAAITPVAAAEPAPMYTRQAVPISSARSFCGVVGVAAMRFARRLPRSGAGGGLLTSLSRCEPKICGMLFGIVEQHFKEDKTVLRARSRGQRRVSRLAAWPC